MNRDLNQIRSSTFDVIIIGGGIIGSAIARDASIRGLKTLLVEKEDFSFGTTAHSSRLIHGGLRYLRSFQLKLVRYDLKEREILLQIAPHLVSRRNFLIPLPRSETFYRLSLPLGLFLYDLLALGHHAPRWKRLSAAKTLNMEPNLKDIQELSGAFLYTDGEAGQMERLCMENLIDASEHGACILNHCSAQSLLKAGNKVSGLEVRDNLSGSTYQVQGKLVINAGGHWADVVWQQLQIVSPEKLRKTKGIHLVTRRLTDNALVLFAKSDNRLFFVIPWGDFSLVGTTDTDYKGNLEKVYADARDVNYLVTETARYFPGFSQKEVLYTFAGLRPLVCKENISASATSRAHRLVDHAKKGYEGLITVLGGKITASRGVAEEAIDLACFKLGKDTPCTTNKTPLPGAPGVSKNELETAAKDYKLPLKSVANLAAIYGSRYKLILESCKTDPRLAQPIGGNLPDIKAQIKWAVENEEAITLSDFLLRRSLIAYSADQGRSVAEAVSHEMAGYLNWDEETRKKQHKEYLSWVDLGQKWLEK